VKKKSNVKECVNEGKMMIQNNILYDITDRNDVFFLLMLGFLDTYLTIDNDGHTLHNLTYDERRLLQERRILP
jgi:hypothetical protein